MTTANSRARNRGKAHERRIAAATGGKRSGNLGQAAADVVSGDQWLCIECKAWSRPPLRVEAALEQAECAAGPDQLPIAVIHTTGRRSSNDLVVLRWGAFEQWFGGMKVLSSGEGATKNIVPLCHSDTKSRAEG